MVSRTEKEIMKYWKDDSNKPFVSICTITYNHEKYIAKALDSFLMQETNFPFEIVAGDDCSPDGTAEVIRKYVKKYPNIIKANLRKKNVGAAINDIENMQRAKGKYLAFCEGDDYWTDPNKLQIQVDFLEKNPDYVISGHDAFIIDEKGKRLQDSKLPLKHKKDYEAEELILGKAWILTMSWVMRNVIPKRFPPEQFKVLNGDTFMTSWLGLYGKSKYHSEIKPAAYRAHSGGIWSMLLKKEKDDAHLNTFYWMYRYYDRIGKKKYAQYHLQKYNQRAISRNSFDKPSVSVLITGKDNLKYYSNFSHIKQLPFNLKLFFNSIDGLRPLHNIDFLNDIENEIRPLDDHCFIPQSDYIVTLDEREILSESDIIKFLEYKTEKRKKNKTPLKEIEADQREIVDDRISVIIPGSKNPKNLKTALKSVVSQDYPSIEVIVVYDHEKNSAYIEETRQIVSSFDGQNTNCNVVLIEHAVKRGISAARNTGIMNSTGGYICFLDENDTYLPGRLSKSIKVLKASDKKVGAVYCGYLGADSEKNDLSRYKTGDLTRELLLFDNRKHYLCTATATYKREAILNISGFDESYHSHQNLEFNLRFFEQYTIEALKEALAKISPEPLDENSRDEAYYIRILETKQKLLNQFSYKIDTYPSDTVKSIYETFWKEERKLISGKSAFVDKINKTHRDGLFYVVNDKNRMDLDASDKKLADLQKKNQVDLDASDKKLADLQKKNQVDLDASDKKRKEAVSKNTSLEKKLTQANHKLQLVYKSASFRLGDILLHDKKALLNPKTLLKKIKTATKMRDEKIQNKLEKIPKQPEIIFNNCINKILLDNSSEIKLLKTERNKCLKYYKTLSDKKSEDVEIKDVNLIPEDWPKDMVLAPLPESTNDFNWKPIHSNNDYTYRSSPGLSIIIPTFNRSKILEITLACLVNQKTDYEFEVIVADDGSKEDLSLVVEKFKTKLKIRLLRQSDEGYRLCAVRNLGLRSAKYDFVAILDCDMAPDTSWVQSYMELLSKDDNVALIGPRKYVDTHDIDPSEILKQTDLMASLPEVVTNNNVAGKIEYEISVDWRLEHFKNSDNLRLCDTPFRYFSGGNVAFSKKWLDIAGWFDEEFTHWGGEDNEFAYRLYRKGCFFRAIDGGLAYHQEPPGKENETDREVGRSITVKIVEQKVPYSYRKLQHFDTAIIKKVPLVSIYIPAYNCENSIEKCIESALNQTVTDLEICVCDDGSTDKTLAILKNRFANDPRVRYMTQKNGGIAKASNSAVKMARGYYIAQLDSDDYLEPDAVELCLKEFMKDRKLACVYTTNRNVNPDGSLIANGYNWPLFSREKLTTTMILHHFRMFTARAWNLTTGFDEDITNAVDYDMFLKLSDVGPFKHINKICYNRVLHGDNTSIKQLGLQKKNHFIAVNKHLNRNTVWDYHFVPLTKSDACRRYKIATKGLPKESFIDNKLLKDCKIMDILVLKKDFDILEFIYYLSFEHENTIKYFSHTIEIPQKLEVLDDSLFRIALYSRPGNFDSYNIIGLKVPSSTKSFFEKELHAKIQVEISTEDEHINAMKTIPEDFHLAFSGGFDSIASKAILGERVRLFSIDFGGAFEREANFFKKFDTTVIKWQLRGEREDSPIRFIEATDWRFMLAPGLIFRKENKPILISTGTIMEASPFWFSGDARPSFSQYYESLAPGASIMSPLACITEYGTTLIVNKFLTPIDISASLDSLAAPNSFKRFRKEVLLSIVSGNELPDKPPSLKKHSFGKGLADDLLGMYLVWKIGKEWTLENYLDSIPDDIPNVDMSFIEKVNNHNLETVDPEMREIITRKLKEYGLFYYSDVDFRNLNLVKSFLKKERENGK